MKLITDGRLALQERSGTVLIRGDEIWTYGAVTNKLIRYTGTISSELKPGAPLPAVSVQDAALAWDGKKLLVADRVKRKVFCLDSASGEETLIMEPGTLDFGDYDTALLVADTVIGDIAWYNSLLYLAVQAGYSSAIYGVDLAKKRVISYRHAPGPKPSGLDFDPAVGSLYITDSRNREIRRFSSAGKVDVAELPSEWEEPRGLSFATDGMLWSADWSTGDVLRLRVED